MRRFLLLLIALGAPAAALAQQDTSEVRSADEIPEDMPEPPDSAPPAEAPAVDGTDERPPHPQTPEPLEEQQPTQETLAQTSYHWLPGHWVWTGEQFEWKSGQWVYKVKDMILVPPRWEWNGKQWVFHDAGWAKPGTNKVVFRTTPGPGGAEATTNAAAPPDKSEQTVEAEPATTTVYVWTGVYVAPLILFPVWHPHYHYHWYHRHPRYRRRPAYRSPRYNYSKTHRRASGPGAPGRGATGPGPGGPGASGPGAPASGAPGRAEPGTHGPSHDAPSHGAPGGPGGPSRGGPHGRGGPPRR